MFESAETGPWKHIFLVILNAKRAEEYFLFKIFVMPQGPVFKMRWILRNQKWRQIKNKSHISSECFEIKTDLRISVISRCLCNCFVCWGCRTLWAERNSWNCFIIKRLSACTDAYQSKRTNPYFFLTSGVSISISMCWEGRTGSGSSTGPRGSSSSGQYKQKQ